MTPESPPLWTGVSGLSNRSLRPGRSLRPSRTGVSGPSGLQRLSFGEGYKYPSPFLQPTSSTRKEKTPLLQVQESLDLPIPPSKLVDLWRIEGEGLDLHLHRAVLHFPLIHLRDHLLGFPLGKPSPLLYLKEICPRGT